jgi:glycerol-3-phosphate O-acyltransferase
MALLQFVLWMVRTILFTFTRVSINPIDRSQLKLDPAKPVCFVLRDRSLADTLVVDEICRREGWPRVTGGFSHGNFKSRFRMVYLTELPAFGRKNARPHPDMLEKLVEATAAQADGELQIVPVSIYWGRAPDKENSVFRLMFSDTWAVPGMLRKLFVMLVQGRNTLAYFSDAISVREVLNEQTDTERSTKKIARVLRVHFRRLRAAVIGPDLSHRRTMVNGLLMRPAVMQAIEAEATKSQAQLRKVQSQARRYADEIAADYSHIVIRILETVLRWLWTRLYDGINILHLDRLQRVAKEHEIIYVPCHRSHIDYLLLSYVLYTNNLVPPHIAAGINLNLPVVGPILRRGGAFFMRRSFKGNRLYTAVFNEYMSTMFERGFSVEYFIEGGRSRTGRLLSPRPGMLAMTLRSFLRSQRRSFVFVPVYIGYERIIEGRTYVSELYGKAKKKESVFDIFRTLQKIRGSFGKVHVNFGEPISLTAMLDTQIPHWRNGQYDDEKLPDWTQGFVEQLGHRIITTINSSAVVNPVNLVSLSMLSTPKHAMDEKALARQLDLYANLLRAQPYSDSVAVTDVSGSEMIDYCERLQLLHRQKHPFGDVVLLSEDKAVTLTYFRNNCIHLFALPSLIACLVANNRRLARSELSELCRQVYPFMRSELFITWDDANLERIIDRYLTLMASEGLLSLQQDEVWAPEPRSTEYVSLSVLASTVKQTLERFYIVLDMILQLGSHKVRRPQLEELCHLMAQRIGMLHEFRTPEFSDKTLFKNFIENMLDLGLLLVDADGKLELGNTLMSSDWHSDRILNPDVRLAIQQVTQFDQDELPTLPEGKAAA